MSTTRPNHDSTCPTRDAAPGHTPDHVAVAAVAAVAADELLECRELLSGLTATYFDNADLTGPSVTRIDADVNFDWNTGAPDPRIGPDSFSAQWTGQVRAAYSERYTFTVQADNSARLWVNGQLLIDQWNAKSVNASGKITLEAGRLNDVILQFSENTGSARVKLLWSSPSQPSQVVPTNMLYPPSTPATALPVTSQPAKLSVRNFGAVGNGVRDDSASIQTAIDALPPYGTLMFEGRTYRLNKSLTIDKPMNVDGHGALLLLNTSAWPTNRHITVQSEFSPTSVRWKEGVVAGQSTFHPTFAPGTFTVGQWVYLELGQDPYDANEQHFAATVPVTAVGVNSVTVGTSVPYAINAGSLDNRLTPSTSLATQVNVRDLKFDHVDGTLPDAAMWIDHARDCTIDGISGRFEIMANVADSTNISLRSATASLVNDHPAAARALTVWQSDNVSLSNVRVDTGVDKAVFFVESWARKTTVSNADVRWRYTQSPTNGVFHLTGGSSGTLATGIRIDNSGPIFLAGSGDQPADYHFGVVTISGALKAASLANIDDLTVGAKRYANPLKLTQTIDLAALWADKRFNLVAGTIKSIKVTASSSGSVNQVFVINAAGQGTVTKTLTAGVALDLPLLGCLGSDYPFNDATGSMKTAALYTPSSIPVGARLTFDIEYYPA